MTTEPSRPRSGRSAGATESNPADKLRTQFAAARVSFTWLGVRKTLSAEQKSQAAESFGAEGQYLSAAKKLLDTKHPAFSAVTSLRSQIVSYWKGRSLPYPEPGVRLIKQLDIDSFNQQLTAYRQLLLDAVSNLDQHFETLKQTARQQLGSLYNPTDYPTSLEGLFAVEWDFPSVEPPQYLLRLNPELYEQETARISARFNEAVQLAEQAFTAELSKLVNHLTERLTGGVDGEKKIFRDTALTNLTEFFTRFKSLNIGSNAELDKLVQTAEQVLNGIDPEAVRSSDGLRQQITTQLSTVTAALDGLLVDQPRRKILRHTESGAGMNRPQTMELLIGTDGTTRCIYGELLDLSGLGTVQIRRASSVEPDARGDWWADLAAVGGPRLGPFAKRSDAIAAEVSWLREQINSADAGALLAT